MGRYAGKGIKIDASEQCPVNCEGMKNKYNL